MKKYIGFFLMGTVLSVLCSIVLAAERPTIAFDEIQKERIEEIIPQKRFQQQLLPEYVEESLSGQPVFEFGALKLKAKGFPLNRMKCGGITLLPRPGRNVQIRAQRFVKSFWGDAAQPSKVLSEWIDLDQGGLRVKYDRAGGAKDYYKIFCRLNGRPVDCYKVLVMQDYLEGHCGWGPGGVDARYAPLNMKVAK